MREKKGETKGNENEGEEDKESVRRRIRRKSKIDDDKVTISKEEEKFRS